jgi:RNA polymerase sigma-70 factor (ECF subfamily)
MLTSKELHEKTIVLHNEMLAGRPTASARLVELLQPRICRALAKKFFNVNDKDLIQTAAQDAVLYYLMAPDKFDANRSSLLGFVWRRAYHNVLNLLKENSRQNKFVELDETQTVYSNETSDGKTIEQFLIDDEQDDLFYKRLSVLLPDSVDRTILELMMNNERETILFAAVLNISDESPEEQRVIVKKHKDRIKKFIQRHRAEIIK